MNEMTFIMVRLVVIILAVVITRYIIPVLKQAAADKDGEQIAEIIGIAVQAAQQTIVDNKEKKAYVLDQVSKWLTDTGLSIDPKQLDMLIEAAVYAMKQEASHG